MFNIITPTRELSFRMTLVTTCAISLSISILCMVAGCTKTNPQLGESQTPDTSAQNTYIHSTENTGKINLDSSQDKSLDALSLDRPRTSPNNNIASATSPGTSDLRATQSHPIYTSVVALPDDRAATNHYNILSGRAYLHTRQNEDPAYGLYSYIVIPSAPVRKEEKDRYLRLHRAFRIKITESSNLERNYSKKKAEINCTYWPLTKRSAEYPRFSNEEELDSYFVDHYDYVRAQMLLSNMRRSDKCGIFIVASHIPVSPRALPNNSTLLLLDATRISDGLLGGLIEYYQHKVASDPQTWQNFFDMQLIALRVKSWLGFSDTVVFSHNIVNGLGWSRPM